MLVYKIALQGLMEKRVTIYAQPAMTFVRHASMLEHHLAILVKQTTVSTTTWNSGQLSVWRLVLMVDMLMLRC